MRLRSIGSFCAVVSLLSAGAAGGDGPPEAVRAAALEAFLLELFEVPPKGKVLFLDGESIDLAGFKERPSIKSMLEDGVQFEGMDKCILRWGKYRLKGNPSVTGTRVFLLESERAGCEWLFKAFAVSEKNEMFTVWGICVRIEDGVFDVNIRVLEGV